MAVPRLRVPRRPARRRPRRAHRPAGLGRGRALPPHLHDPAALQRRDAAARARAVAPLDDLEPARAGRLRGARPRRVPVRDPAAARRRVERARDRHGPGGRGASRATASARSTSGQPLEAPARRRRWYDDGEGTMAVLLASASDLDDLIPTLVAYQIEWNKLRLRLRAADWPPDRRRSRRRRSAPPSSAGPRTTGCSSPRPWGDEAADRAGGGRPAAAQPAHPDARRLLGRLRAHDAPLVGPGAGDAGRARAARPADVLRLLQPALARQPALGHRPAARGRGDRLGRDRRPARPARRARRRSATAAPRARGRTSSTSRRATSSRRSRPSCARRARTRSARSASATSRRAPRCASPRR